MLGKKRYKKEINQNINQKNILELNYKEISSEKDINFPKKLIKKKNLNPNKNEGDERKVNIESISKSSFSEHNIKIEKYNAKYNFEQIKQKFKQLDNNYGENNISIINNIDRLTSLLSSIIIEKNKQNIFNGNKEMEINYINKEKRKEKNEIDKNYSDKEIIEDIKPLVIDANKDQYLNYLLTLNDSLKKKINDDIRFDEIYQFFSNYSFQKIENFLKYLKSIDKKA